MSSLPTPRFTSVVWHMLFIAALRIPSRPSPLPSSAVTLTTSFLFPRRASLTLLLSVHPLHPPAGSLWRSWLSWWSRLFCRARILSSLPGLSCLISTSVHLLTATGVAAHAKSSSWRHLVCGALPGCRGSAFVLSVCCFFPGVSTSVVPHYSGRFPACDSLFSPPAYSAVSPARGRCAFPCTLALEMALIGNKIELCGLILV